MMDPRDARRGSQGDDSRVQILQRRIAAERGLVRQSVTRIRRSVTKSMDLSQQVRLQKGIVVGAVCAAVAISLVRRFGLPLPKRAMENERQATEHDDRQPFLTSLAAWGLRAALRAIGRMA